MKVIELHDDDQINLQRLYPPGNEKRLPGITRVIGSMMSEIDPKRYDPDREFNPVLGRLGYLWEDVLGSTLASYERHVTPRVIVRPRTPYIKDGLVGYPDGVRVRRPIGIVECKTTFASARKKLSDPFFTYYHMQGMALCWMAGYDTTIYYALHVCGDYTRPFSPTMATPTAIKWTEEEMRENWEGITHHARKKGWI